MTLKQRNSAFCYLFTAHSVLETCLSSAAAAGAHISVQLYIVSTCTLFSAETFVLWASSFFCTETTTSRMLELQTKSLSIMVKDVRGRWLLHLCCIVKMRKSVSDGENKRRPWQWWLTTSMTWRDEIDGIQFYQWSSIGNRSNQFRMEKTNNGADSDEWSNIGNLVAKQSRADHTRRQTQVPETESTITTSHNKTETGPQTETRQP